MTPFFKSFSTSLFRYGFSSFPTMLSDISKGGGMVLNVIGMPATVASVSLSDVIALQQSI